MKKKYTIKLILTLSLFICFTVSLCGQIRFLEVDPTTESVTIKNFSISSTIDISDYKLCVFPNYPKLSTLSPSGSLNLGPGDQVTVTSTADLINAGGEVGLYIDTFDFESSANIRDYIQWISTTGVREPVAVNAGIWGMDDAISGSVLPPFAYTGDGSQTGVSSWGSALSTEDFSINSFSISPNPSRESIQIQFPSFIRNASVEVFDVLGKRVYNEENIIGKIIDVSQWSKGIYLIKATSNNKTKTKRFVKQ